MRYLGEMLERTSLKYLGAYLLCGGEPGEYIKTHDQTEDELTDQALERIEALMCNQDKAQAAKILDAAASLCEASKRIGFYTGIKVGAKLMLQLTDENEIIF